MSRIGKKSIAIPSAVKLAVSPEGAVKVEGPKGKLEWTLPKQIKVRVDGGEALVQRHPFVAAHFQRRRGRRSGAPRHPSGIGAIATPMPDRSSTFCFPPSLPDESQSMPA